MQAPLAPAQLEKCLGLYRISRLLHATAELGVAPALADGPRSVDDIAAITATDGASMRAFLDALSAWGVFARESDGRYALTPFSRRLVPGAEGAMNIPIITGWAGSNAVFGAFEGLSHTLATGESGLKGTRGIDFHGYLAGDPRQAQLYNAAMLSTADSFEAAARAWDFGACRTVVDIGGGQGGLLRQILARHPQVRGVCFDLPHVIDHAAPAGTDERLEFVAGDAFDGVPAGADAYLTNTVLRCFNDASCARLLDRVREAMTHPDARLVCFEIVLPPGKDDPVLALADMTARVVYGGRDRSEQEFRELFAGSGLELLSAVPFDGAMRALACRRAR
jgi:hypothetical protein